MVTEEQYHHEARVTTARHFNIPLWYVEVNTICHYKGVEWFYLYEGEDGND